jgi:hypothetical protein
VTISRLLGTVLAGGVALPAEDLVVSLDESRAPFATAQVSVPYDPATVDLLDPRARPVPRVTVGLVQRFHDTDPLSALSAAYAARSCPPCPRPTRAGPWPPSPATTGRVEHFGFRSSRSLTLDLGIRSRTIDHAAGTVDLVLASDEALLTDGALVAAAPVSPPVLTVLGAVQLVLGLLLPGYTLTTTQGAQAWPRTPRRGTRGRPGGTT